jgi:hypothetical protein
MSLSDSSCPTHRAKESHNDWNTTWGSPQCRLIYMSNVTTNIQTDVLDAHGLAGCTTLQLPPLRASNHREAVAALKARRAALLDHAEYLAFLASAFSDVNDVAEILIGKVESLIAQADKCLVGQR